MKFLLSSGAILLLRKFYIVLCVVSCCLFFGVIRVDAAQKGSETVVSVEPVFTFSAADSDNTMLAFGYFKNGFTLEDNTTTCTFESIFPVGGDISLNGGTLRLQTDLEVENGEQKLRTKNGVILSLSSNEKVLEDDEDGNVTLLNSDTLTYFVYNADGQIVRSGL
jgi:hypothetical protein